MPQKKPVEVGGGDAEVHVELVRSCRGRGSDERSSLCLSTEPGAVPGCPKTRGAWWGAWHGAGPAQLLSTTQPMLRVLGYSKQFRLFLLYLLALCIFIKLTEVTGGSGVRMDVR